LKTFDRISRLDRIYMIILLNHVNPVKNWPQNKSFNPN
jgi:hypothetical protein